MKPRSSKKYVVTDIGFSEYSFTISPSDRQPFGETAIFTRRGARPAIYLAAGAAQLSTKTLRPRIDTSSHWSQCKTHFITLNFRLHFQWQLKKHPRRHLHIFRCNCNLKLLLLKLNLFWHWRIRYERVVAVFILTNRGVPGRPVMRLIPHHPSGIKPRQVCCALERSRYVQYREYHVNIGNS